MRPHFLDRRPSLKLRRILFLFWLASAHTTPFLATYDVIALV